MKCYCDLACDKAKEGKKILVNIFNFIDWVAKKELFASGKIIMTTCLISELIHAFGFGFGFSTDVKGHVQKKKQ